MPYLEQDNLHKQIDFKTDVANPIHAQVRVTSLNVFLCPSDTPTTPTFTVVAGGGSPVCDVAFANYVGIGGTFEVTGFPDSNTGVLLRNSRYRVASITDGTSSTVVVTERESRKSPMTTWVGAVTDSVNPPLNPAFEEEGPPTLVLTQTGEGAEGRSPNNSLGHVEDAGSRHPGGVNALFGDGSVRFIRNSISPFTWEALGTREGGEVVGDY